MTTVNTTKKPFGLSLAVRVALEAIRESIAPASVVFSNLFYLKNTPNFPKDLDKHFFANSKNIVTDAEKKEITKLLDSIKRPQVDLQLLLEGALEAGWVKKVPPKVVAKPVAKKVVAAKKNKKPAAPKKEVVAPTIIVKKTRNI